MTQEEIEKQAEELKDEECKKLFSSDKAYNGLTVQDFWEEGFSAGAKWGIANAIEFLEEARSKRK